MQRTRKFEETLLSMHAKMVEIRQFEENLVPALERKEIKCPVHLCDGAEAVAVGVCANLTKQDLVFSAHRAHGYYLAKGGNPQALLDELHGKPSGCSKGYGGSMHIVDESCGFMGSNGIIADCVPLAVGAAFSQKHQGKPNIVAVFFGDGATNEGVYYESLNLAALWKLPIIFICENNYYSAHMPIAECLADTRIYKRAEAFGIESHRIDGNNVLEVYATTQDAARKARRGKGPTFIECLTYRIHGHVGPNIDLDKGLRSQIEYDRWMQEDPIKRYEKILDEKHLLRRSHKRSIMADS